MILTVGNTKGGVGKTTIAIQIALARASAGKDVWLVDGDRQGTALAAITIRGEAQPSIACSQYTEGPTLRGQVLKQSGRYADTIIDVGGQDSMTLRAALILSDVVLVPFRPRSFDVWALAQVAALIDEARSVRDGLQVFAMLNAADPSGSDNQEAIEALAGYPQMALLASPLGNRKAFANASGFGRSVTEAKPIDAKACAEVEALVSKLFSYQRDIR